MATDAHVHTIETLVSGRYLVRAPASDHPLPIIVGFHGYGESAQDHLDELACIPGADDWVLVAVQGLHRFYERKTGTVVASWMTFQDREQMIAHNVTYVDAVVDAVRARYTTALPLVYSGFSQGVAMAYRAAILGAHRPAAVIALAGDVPPELHDDSHPWWPSVLLGRGADDRLYTQDHLDEDLAFLAMTGAPLESVSFEGGHGWHDDFRRAAGRLLNAVRRSASPCPQPSR